MRRAHPWRLWRRKSSLRKFIKIHPFEEIKWLPRKVLRLQVQLRRRLQRLQSIVREADKAFGEYLVENKDEFIETLSSGVLNWLVAEWIEVYKRQTFATLLELDMTSPIGHVYNVHGEDSATKIGSSLCLGNYGPKRSIARVRQAKEKFKGLPTFWLSHMKKL